MMKNDLKKMTYSRDDSDEYKDYVNFWVSLYILKEANYEHYPKSDYGAGVSVTTDFKTQLRFQLIEEILERFTALELHIIFHFYPYNHDVSAKELRKLAIENLDDTWGVTDENKQSLKNKIWSMSPTYFQLVYQLIIESNVFDYEF